MSGKHVFVKFPVDFFDDKAVIFVEREENGNLALFDYIKMMFASTDTYGIISNKESDIAEMIGESEDDVAKSVPVLRYWGLLIPVSDSEYQIRDINEKRIFTNGEPDGRDRNSIEYRFWRKSVFDRDNYTCQTCGKRGVPVEAHHIVRWVDNMELRFDVANGITLCKSCHRDIHGKRGKDV